MARKTWWDYRYCDRRPEAVQERWPLQYQLVARDLARRGVSPKKWSIYQCPVRDWTVKDGCLVIHPCTTAVAVRNFSAELADYDPPEADLGAFRERYDRRYRWHAGFKAHLCSYHHLISPAGAGSSLRSSDQWWEHEQELRQQEYELAEVMAALSGGPAIPGAFDPPPIPPEERNYWGRSYYSAF